MPHDDVDHEVTGRAYRENRDKILRHLAGETVEESALWLAVGYFLYGGGTHSNRGFATPQQWEKLRAATGRPAARSSD